MAEKKATDGRTRNWTCVVYPDSAPDGWESIIDEEHIEWACSPLHDKDVNPTGEPKKPHWHVVFAFSGVKTYEQVLKITSSVNATIPKRVESMQGMVNYLTHSDNPEKAQYSKADIRCFGGFDVVTYSMPTRSQRYAIIREMMSWCVDNDIIEFEDLLLAACSDQNVDTWFPLLCDNSAMVMSLFLKSRRHRNQPARYD